MRNKIFFRLVLYFITSFFIFSLIIAIVFSGLFSQHNIRLHKAELESQTINVAGTLSEMFEGSFTSERSMGAGRGRMCIMGGMDEMSLSIYLQSVEDMVRCSIWVIDRNFEQITFANRHRHMHMGVAFNYEDLPEYAEQVITDAFEGTVSVSENFSEFLGVPSITAAAPIILETGEIIGVVLLHIYVSDVQTITTEGLTLLAYSMSIGVVISIIIAALLSLRFTKPLNKMKNTALKISSGDYTSKTGVKQSDEIGELATVLDEMAGRLDQSSKESAKLDKLRRDFVANISHELRTPITVIRGSLEAIRDRVVTDTDKIASYHDQMFSETIFLERLVTDLLDLARLQNLDFVMDMNDVNLKDIVTDVVRGMSGLAERKGVYLTLTQSNGDFSFVGDYGRLRQMLIIVLDNAIKFSDVGKTVNIELSKFEGNTNIAIRDEGCGIHADDLPYIFERFYKQRSEHNKIGSGLGLAIAKQIADRHGVFVEVKSSSDNGTEFSFTFQMP